MSKKLPPQLSFPDIGEGFRKVVRIRLRRGWAVTKIAHVPTRFAADLTFIQIASVSITKHSHFRYAGETFCPGWNGRGLYAEKESLERRIYSCLTFSPRSKSSAVYVLLQWSTLSWNTLAATRIGIINLRQACKDGMNSFKLCRGTSCFSNQPINFLLFYTKKQYQHPKM